VGRIVLKTVGPGASLTERQMLWRAWAPAKGAAVTMAGGVGGVLLTGGGSRRMGFDKALIEVAGLPNAVRLARALCQVADPVVEVGPGFSGLPALREEPPGAGPLVALCAGARHLAGLGWSGPVLVAACDLPLAGSLLFEAIASWPSSLSVVPLVNGVAQPLCARWSHSDLAVATTLASSGERSMKALLRATNFSTFGPGDWPSGVSEEDFADADTPADLERAGLRGER